MRLLIILLLFCSSVVFASVEVANVNVVGNVVDASHVISAYAPNAPSERQYVGLLGNNVSKTVNRLLDESDNDFSVRVSYIDGDIGENLYILQSSDLILQKSNVVLSAVRYYSFLIQEIIYFAYNGTSFRQQYCVLLPYAKNDSMSNFNITINHVALAPNLVSFEYNYLYDGKSIDVSKAKPCD